MSFNEQCTPDFTGSDSRLLPTHALAAAGDLRASYPHIVLQLYNIGSRGSGTVGPSGVFYAPFLYPLLPSSKPELQLPVNTTIVGYCAAARPTLNLDRAVPLGRRM